MTQEQIIYPPRAEEWDGSRIGASTIQQTPRVGMGPPLTQLPHCVQPELSTSSLIFHDGQNAIRLPRPEFIRLKRRKGSNGCYETSVLLVPNRQQLAGCPINRGLLR